MNSFAKATVDTDKTRPRTFCFERSELAIGMMGASIKFRNKSGLGVKLHGIHMIIRSPDIDSDNEITSIYRKSFSFVRVDIHISSVVGRGEVPALRMKQWPELEKNSLDRILIRPLGATFDVYVSKVRLVEASIE